MKCWSWILVWAVLGTVVGFGAEEGVVTPVADVVKEKKLAVVLPVRGEIADPVLYVVRRGVKEAIEMGADLVVVDMNTPGGRVDVMFELVEVLEKFGGRVVTLVNKEAISAGALIAAATDEIWFVPGGTIGAAAPVLSTGGEIGDTMKAKVLGFLKAKVRAGAEGKGGRWRAQVVEAMIDAKGELKIDGKVLKKDGDLLTLTAKEACEFYGKGKNRQRLLGEGIVKDVRGLLDEKFGEGKWEMVELKMTWSEQLAKWLNAVSPILMALGLVALFIEFKTPGFGIFGVSGVVLLGLVFLGKYVAGLSGYEPALVFALGVGLIVVELLVFPGVVAGVTGVVLMLGAFVWAMVDVWPNEPVRFDAETFGGPLLSVGLGVLLALVVTVLLVRFLPKGWIWGRMILEAEVSGASQGAGGVAGVGGIVEKGAGLVGRRGVAVTALRPSGQVEIEGLRYEASVSVGVLDAGTEVVVVGVDGFGVRVEKCVGGEAAEGGREDEK